MKENEINVSKFFEDNSKLFVVIGVFSALSVYFATFLTQPGNREKTTVFIATNLSFNPLEYVIVACYLIVILIILALLKQISYSEKDGFYPFYFFIGIDAIKRIVLIIPLILIGSGIIFTILFVYTSLIFPFSLILVTFLGIITFFTAFVVWTKIYYKYTKNDPAGCISFLIFSILMIFILGSLEAFSLNILIPELAILLFWYFGIIGTGVVITVIIAIVLCAVRIFHLKEIFQKIMHH